jgi:MYXO-CTERM domain-containing protein
VAEESDAQGAETRTSVDGRETSDVNVDVVFASDAAAPESASDGGANAADGALAAIDGAGNGTSAGNGSGCSCAVAGREHTSALALFWGFAALLLAHRTRRRRVR